jgi:uncharacterized membrane protein
MNRYLTVGLTVIAGAALFEAVLIPGVVIGGAVVLMPRYLPTLRRRLRPAFDAVVRSRIEPSAPLPDRQETEQPLTVPAGFGVKQALAKTVTFRIINTAVDFTTNYVVIGEFAAAVSLSIFALAVGPLFYFAHEAAWNYLGPSGTGVDFRALVPLRRDDTAIAERLEISRPLAKTITFRTFATAVDFTSNYVVIADLAAATGLSIVGFVVGPLIYLGHEMAWDHYSAPKQHMPEQQAPTSLLPPVVRQRKRGRRNRK